MEFYFSLSQKYPEGRHSRAGIMVHSIKDSLPFYFGDLPTLVCKFYLRPQKYQIPDLHSIWTEITLEGTIQMLHRIFPLKRHCPEPRCIRQRLAKKSEKSKLSSRYPTKNQHFDFKEEMENQYCDSFTFLTQKMRQIPFLLQIRK